ncbi:MAG: DUF6607 family protein [Pseudomonadales bacterium]
MAIRIRALAAAALALSFTTTAVDATAATAPAHRQYTYSWLFSDSDTMRPRGGTTKGPDVVLETKPSAAWQALQDPKISAFERDRRAILAMSGPYRTSFDFIETVGFVAGYTPERPYQSWGTEYIYVVADEPEFISLQHIIVMFFEAADGAISEPMVVKHWRQDWRYEDRDLHVYVGHNSWQQKRLSRQAVKGAWSQAVFQVDDSPRYEAIGRWQHHGNYSSWQSENTWRPLPRREFSVRDDYHVLSGTNRHTITPTGWVQEEDNLKLVLNENGRPREVTPYLARETGLSRYELIVGHDFSAGDNYWKTTAPFWADVRNAWEDTRKRREQFTLKPKVDGQRLFEVMFGYAGKLETEEEYDSRSARAFIDATLERFVD